MPYSLRKGGKLTDDARRITALLGVYFTYGFPVQHLLGDPSPSGISAVDTRLSLSLVGQQLVDFKRPYCSLYVHHRTSDNPSKIAMQRSASPSDSSTPRTLTPDSTGSGERPESSLDVKRSRRQTAFYPNMKASNKPLKPFSRSAAKRESVMALGSIEHLQHYFTKTGLSAPSK